MKTKKFFKILIAILIAISLFTVLHQTVSAFGITDKTIDNLKKQGDQSTAKSTLTNFLSAAVRMFRVIGTGIALIMLIVLAIRFIMASPEGRAEIKKSSTVYILGAIIIFSASVILSIVQSFVDKNIIEESPNTTN